MSKITEIVTKEDAERTYREMITRAAAAPEPAWRHAISDHARYYLALCNYDEVTCRGMETEARAKLRAALRVVR